MNKIVKTLFVSYIILTCFICKQVYAQQNHFIYIQADDKQTFSVEVNNKTYNSTDIGYVIIPKLTDGKYRLNISFPNNKFPDQEFNCVIDKADAGFALKNYGDKGWGLFNFQSLYITMSGNNAAAAATQNDTVKLQTDTTKLEADTTKTNAFGDMLSQVVNDTSLKITPVDQSANKQQSVPVNDTNKQKVESAAASSGDSLQKTQSPQNQTPPADTAVVLNKSMIKIAEKTTDSGVDMVFVDPASGNDTIKIFVPSQQEQQKKTEDSAVVKNETKDLAPPTDTTQAAPEVKKEDKNPLADTLAASQSQVNNPFFSGKKTNDTASKSNIENNPAENKPSETNPLQIVYKPDCPKMLSDNDLNKLKKKMVSGNRDDKMIQTARKYFEDKCITTEQVKSLGALFLSDDARYNFFDAAYPNVYDISTFPSLENQLIDPYYKKRFRAMLK